jgi:hypothetical protein
MSESKCGTSNPQYWPAYLAFFPFYLPVLASFARKYDVFKMLPLFEHLNSNYFLFPESDPIL